ncbi:LuxR C-terminal-related transcriptional regulator [Streptomyces sp. FH025]|uniref:LuxR C-terminal-related transcriptional regulator n=1 Tax=Streptomyces sp. FH025 TaxID=2815937 RepID=UPI001A9DE3A2|nr:LuxR C-terminal-related transcriptional regulator [Streptomyces sp. FH025]MBO1414395.1 response regulator transcription factor [Streptomyces sp. FH025]
MPDLDLPDANARELYREILKEGGRIRISDIRPEDEPTVRIRVLDAPFSRILIFDRIVSLMPAAPDNTVAVVVEDPAVVAYLAGVFDQHWQQAEAVDWAVLASGSAGPAVHEQVGRLLARGLTQRAIASRMGLSERTVAGHIARLRELYDAETLFQLGWQMRRARTGGAG